MHLSPSSWPSLPPPTPGHTLKLSQSTYLSSLSHTANSHWLSILHTVVYTFPSGSWYLLPNCFPIGFHWGFLGGSAVKNLPTMQETWVWSMCQEDPLEEGMATRSSVLSWRIPWTEEPSGLHTVHRVTKSWKLLSTHAHRFSLIYNATGNIRISISLHLKQELGSTILVN